MNVFMGYNPLVGKQVKITTFNYEVDGDGADPLFPQYGDCLVYFADSIAEQEGDYDDAYMFNGDDWEELGGGVPPIPTTIPRLTFSPTSESGGTYSCDVSFDDLRRLIVDTHYGSAWCCYISEKNVFGTLRGGGTGTIDCDYNDFNVTQGAFVVRAKLSADGTYTNA